ncbi:MAG: TetR family transcriptional regulator [Streptosporangiales bacterium]|nr:TetR family transcriptional regulator [Streptosporangiales bacterium]
MAMRMRPRRIMATDHVGSGDLIRTLGLLWSDDEAAVKPGPKPKLTQEKVVTAGITVADRDGLEGLTMRAVAEELGISTMALYRYVPGKGELLDLMLERLNGPVGEPAWGPGEWRNAMESMAEGMWRLYLDHPWFLQVNQARPLLGPRSLEGLDIILRAFDELGISDVEKVGMLTAVSHYVGGLARETILQQQAATQSGVTDEEFWSAQEPYLAKAFSDGRFPHVAALDPHCWETPPIESMRFGLEAMLDGFEQRFRT